MEDFDILINGTLENYFDTLTKIGYYDNSKVNNILCLIALRDILYKFSTFVTEEDFKTIKNVLNCISGDCNIPALSHFTDDTLYHPLYFYNTFRNSEEGRIRGTENSFLRVKD